MKQSIKLRENLFLNIDSINATEVENTKQTNKNFFFIGDNSGSMYHVIRQLREDLNNKIRNVIKDGDTISLAKFSSQGDFEYFTVGFRKAIDSDFDLIERKIDENFTASGLTCFSEVLKELPNKIKEVTSNYEGENIICFLTDGYPVTSNNTKEEEETLKSLEEVKSLVNASVFVGYGNYYNRELMAKMAEVSNGSLIHADEFKDYEASTNELFEDYSSNFYLVEKEIGKELKYGISFTKNNGKIINHKIEDTKIDLYVPKNQKSDFGYFTKDAEFDVVKKNDAIDDDSLLSNIYSAIYSLFKRDKKLDALTLLGYLGDVYLIDMFNNCITNVEYAVFEKELLKAINFEHSRFVHGRKANYVPSVNKFCLLEFVELIKEDESVLFYPFETEYNKTTQEYKQKDETLKFVYDKGIGYNVKDLTFNKEEVNLSIRMKMTGTLDLTKTGDEYKKLNLPDTYNTFVWRNYSIVSDGNLNMKEFPITMSEETFKKLQKKYVISRKEEFVEGQIYNVNLTKMPVINKKMVEEKANAQELAEDQYRLEEIKAQLKVINATIPSKTDKFYSNAATVIGKEASEFLKKYGITAKNGYSPKKESTTKDNPDYRLARTFKIKVSGLSSLPKIEDVKIKNSKTISYTLMRDEIERIENMKEEDICQRRKMLEIEKRILTKEIQKSVFATILGRTKLEGIDGDSLVLENGTKVTFDFGEKKVRI